MTELVSRWLGKFVNEKVSQSVRELVGGWMANWMLCMSE